MADEPKPKASFLGGKSAAPPPAEVAAPALAAPAIATPAGGSPGFLKGRGAPINTPAPSPVPALAPAPAPIPISAVATRVQNPGSAVVAPPPPPVLKPTGNRALAEQYLQRGINHYDAQETEQALGAYQQCVQADPTFGLGYNSMGMVLIDLERYEEALEALYQSVRCDDTYAEAFNNLGFVLRRMQRPIDAIAAYTRFLALEPDVEEGPRIQGWIETVMQENNLHEIPPLVLPGDAPPEAPAAPPSAAPEPVKIKKMAAWEVAAGNTETLAPVDVLGGIGDAAPTIPSAPPHPAAPPPPMAPPPPAAAKPAVAAPRVGGKPGAPTGAIALVEKAMDQFADGKLEQAEALFQQAATAEPNNPEGHIGLAKVWIRQEKLNEAIELLQKAVQMDASDPAGFYVLGFALRAVERNVEASDAYETFLKLMPDALDADKMKQWVAHVKGVPEAAAAEVEEAVDDEQIVTEVDQKYKTALNHFQDGDVDTSLRECIKVLNEDPGHIRTRVLLGRAYLRQKEYDNAIEQFEAALVTRPDYPEALYFLGQGAEKKGAHDKAVTSYKRYLDVAPSGPRAERLRDWVITNGAATLSGASKQAQCELCLRFFPENEMTQHEGRATCSNCMSVMGGTPTMEMPVLSLTETPPVSPPIETSRPKGKVVMLGGKGKIAVLLVIGLLIGWTVLKKQLSNSIVATITTWISGKKPAPPPVNPDTPQVVTPLVPAMKFDPTKVKITNEPLTRLTLLARWSYAPLVEGLELLDTTNPGWKKEFVVKGEPQGMTIDPATGQMNWTPEFTDFEALKKGVAWKMELIVKGTSGDSKIARPDGSAPQELFSVSKPFTLGCQFGYELGAEADMGLASDERIALAVGEFSGDDLIDTVVGAGSFRDGTLKMYVQRKGNAMPTPAELAGKTTYSALFAGDLDGDKRTDLLCADWLKGRLKLFYQKQNEFAADSPEIAIGAGPVALAAADLDGDKLVEVAALLGPGNALAVTTLDAAHKFGEVTTIPLNGIGGHGWVLPWTSAEAGPGFLVVSPLSASALQFIPHNKGQWHKGTPGIVESSGDASDVIMAVSVLAGGANGPARLALLISGKSNRLVLLEERGGKFTPVGQATPLPSIGVGLLARDFNQDGQDDLLVVSREESSFYFVRGNDLLPGPRYATQKANMLGPIAVFSVPGNELPDLLLINENRKAQVLKAVLNDPFAAPDYDIKLSRPSKAGDKYHLASTGVLKVQVKSGANGGAPIKEKDFSVKLDAAVEVLAVTANGGESKKSLRIEKCVKTAAGASNDLIPAGKTLIAEFVSGRTVFSIKNTPLTPDVLEALDVVLSTSAPDATESTEFEPGKRQRVGDSWPANAEVLCAEYKRRGMNLKPDDVNGRVKLESLASIGGVDCLNVSVDFTLKPEVASPVAQFEVQSNSVKILQSFVVPAESMQSALEEKSSTITSTALTGKQGSQVLTTDLTVEKTVTSKRSAPREGEFTVEAVKSVPGEPASLEAIRDFRFNKPKASQKKISSLKVESMAGDFIGQGMKTGWAGTDLTVKATDKLVTINVDGWTIEFSPQKGKVLNVGPFDNAERHPFNDSSPGIAFSGHGRACNKIKGKFVIWEFVMKGAEVQSMAIDFVQRCEGSGPPLAGMLRFNASFE